MFNKNLIPKSLIIAYSFKIPSTVRFVPKVLTVLLSSEMYAYYYIL